MPTCSMQNDLVPVFENKFMKSMCMVSLYEQLFEHRKTQKVKDNALYARGMQAKAPSKGHAFLKLIGNAQYSVPG